MTLDVYSEHRFNIQPNTTQTISVTASYVYFFDFTSADLSKPPMLEVSFNYGEFATLRETFEVDVSEVVRGVADNDSQSDIIKTIRIRNVGDAAVVGYFGTSQGRIRTNITAISSNDNEGLPVEIRAPSPVVTADMASLDDSGIVLNSEIAVSLDALRGIGNLNVITPRGYRFNSLNTLSYTGLEIGKIYAFDIERIESLPQWWGINQAQNQKLYKIDVTADVRVYTYNGSGATQKRGYRRGGLFMSWEGRHLNDEYGNIYGNVAQWASTTGANVDDSGRGNTSFTERSVENRPFIFKASATSLTLQFLTSGEARWSEIGTHPGDAPFGTGENLGAGSGGFRIRSSIQPIEKGALA